ncbi:MAG: hypothetical protein LUG83_07765 [Lachnospiraceae bacterium]|nr:hypothetical protein [Lachnospiraceae bacterium]
MESTCNKKNKYFSVLICILAAVVTFIPAFRENISFWRSAGQTAASGIAGLVIIQILTAFGFFVLSFSLSKDIIVSFSGVVLYLTCPYRIYILFDCCDMGKCIVWALLPWLLWGLFSASHAGKIKWVGIAAAVAALAIIGYSDFVWLAITFAVILPAAALFRRTEWLFISVAGGVAALPKMLPYFDYCLRGGGESLEISIISIMNKGYEFGQMFTGFAYRDNLPGMGIGLFIVLFAMLWLRVVENAFRPDAAARYIMLLCVILFIFSLACFPWDYVERAGAFFMRAVSVIGTPAVFFGYGCMLMCILGVYVIRALSNVKNSFASGAIPTFMMCISVFAAFNLGFDI